MRLGSRIVSKVEQWILRAGIVDEIDGIKICDLGSKQMAYRTTIKRSLNLIKQLDSRRYRVVKKELTWLVNSRIVQQASGKYLKRHRAGFINFISNSNDEILLCADYAGLIVNLATHGRLYSKHVGNCKDRRIRIEQVCAAEENRFLLRVEAKYPEYRGTLTYELDKDINTKEISKWRRTLRILIRIMKG